MRKIVVSSKIKIGKRNTRHICVLRKSSCFQRITKTGSILLVNLEGCKTVTQGQAAVTLFESLVNLEGCKTMKRTGIGWIWFESLVNLEGCKTLHPAQKQVEMFESLVNLEGCKTQDQY